MLLANGTWAQSSFRTHYISYATDTLTIDSLSVDPTTFTIEGVDTSFYWFDPAAAQLAWKKNPKADSVKVSYRRMNVNFAKPYSHKSQVVYGGSRTSNPFKIKGNQETNNLFELNELKKNGSISRGVSFGNNQDIGVSSNLNLELSGRLKDDIFIKAAISDKNIPIQPDGNTQQLQDFDQVYIQLYNKKFRLTGGDFQTTSTRSRFLKYNKRLRGGDFSGKLALGKQKQNETNFSFSGAISRGKFSRNIIQGVEGNQGPYRLTGASNEVFIVVLSGTEKVYVDGKLLKRGRDNDYVIDYNRGTITFTSKMVMTKDKRIAVEFQYSTQAYTRTLIRYDQDFKTKRSEFYAGVYSEQDGKNQSLQQQLSVEQKQILKNAGDDPSKAISSGAEVVPFSDDKVLYRLQLDTLLSGQVDSIFVYSTNPDSAKYQLKFTDVGLGNGDYVQSASSPNGTVFEYVPPVNGVRQGRYIPFVVLIVPERRQMFVLGGKSNLTKSTSLSFEGAVSSYDKNTFSSKDAGDNEGIAFWVALETKRKLSKTGRWHVNSKAVVEQVSKNFTQIERIRSVEFQRDWNIRNVVFEQDQWLPKVGISLSKSKAFQLGYELETLLAGSQYSALKHNALVKVDTPKWKVNSNFSKLDSRTSTQLTDFKRHTGNASRKLGLLEIGVENLWEENQFLTKDSLKLNTASYRFLEWKAFVKTNDSLKNGIGLDYINRWDDRAREGAFVRVTNAESVGGNFFLNNGGNSSLKGRLNYRRLKVVDTTLYTLDPEENITSRLEYRLNLLKRGIISSSFYEVGSGLEEKLGFLYIEVGQGQGLYTWNDYNNDQVKDPNEFELAQFKDQANYIRVSRQTNEFIRVYSILFNQSILIDPARFWKSKTGFKKVLTKFSDQVSISLNRKTQREEGLARFNPFELDVADSILVSTNTSFKNTLFFQKVHRRFGADWTMQRSENQIQTLNGSEKREQAIQKIKARYYFNSTYSLKASISKEDKLTISSAFESRNFDLDVYRMAPSLVYRPSGKMEWTGEVEYAIKENVKEYGGQESEQWKYELKVRFNSVGKGLLQLSASVVDVKISSKTNGSVLFEMLEGVQPGTNGIWEMSFQRSLGKYLQVSVNYNGRVSETANTVHAGSVMMRASF